MRSRRLHGVLEFELPSLGQSMRRRDFITLTGGVAAWPLVARAQQPTANVPIVTFLNARKADAGATAVAADFRRGLSQTGLTEGKDVIVEYHWLDGHYEDIPAILNDAVRRHVAVIATPGNSPASLAAKAATSTIPIVFGVGQDPVALGLVASLAQPGGNVTGINFFASEIDAKRLGLMHELLPKAKRFAVLINPGNPVTAEATTKTLNEAAPSLGLELLVIKANTPAEIDAAFSAIADARADALFIAPDAFFTGRGSQLITLAARDRIPTSTFTGEVARAGLLMSYGTNLADVFRQVGVYTGSILKGTKPADLPVLQSTKFEFILNLQTARSLGIDVPPTLLARADEVIE
jgi:putative ABC transport system substrate-binding protein